MIDPHVVVEVETGREFGQVFREKFGSDKLLLVANDKCVDLPPLGVSDVYRKVLAP